MIVERRLLITKPLLASRILTGENDSRKRVFVKEPSNDGGHLIRTNTARWQWALLEARDNLDLRDVSVDTICPATSFYVGARNLSSIDIKGQLYECIMEDTEMKTRFVITKTIPPHASSRDFMRCPETEEFDAMLTHIGEFLGMSDSKNNLQYGTFKIING